MRKLILSVTAIVLLAGAAFAQPKVKSQKEAEALQAVFAAQDVAGRFKAGEEFLTKFADTEFKGTVLYILTATAQQANDFEKMMIYGERTLEADPKNFATMIIIANGLAQRTKEFDLDKEEKLGRAEKLAKDAMELVKTATKPNPQLTDEQWEQAKKDFDAQAHESLGLIAMNRKKWDVAMAEFKLAVESSSQPDPATMVRWGAACNGAGKPDEAIAVLDKVLAIPDVHPAVKQFAQQEKSRAMQLKGGAKPAAPAAPPQVEIKKP